MRIFCAQQGVQRERERERYCCVLSSVVKRGKRIFKQLFRVYNKFLDVYISEGLRR